MVVYLQKDFPPNPEELGEQKGLINFFKNLCSMCQKNQHL